jgi:hypothetical protein
LSPIVEPASTKFSLGFSFSFACAEARSRT